MKQNCPATPQIDWLLKLVKERNRGNSHAAEWVEAAMERIHTGQGEELAQQIVGPDPTNWWVNKGGK